MYQRILSEDKKKMGYGQVVMFCGHYFELLAVGWLSHFVDMIVSYQLWAGSHVL